MSTDKQILLGLTTTAGSNWRDKVEEIKQLGLTEVALFPTTLAPAERQSLYKMLEGLNLAAIPYVHMRDDFTVEEVDYLVSRFKVKALSCHGDDKGYGLLDRLPKYNSIIYVENFADENADALFDDLHFMKHQVSGICLDLAHLEEARRASKKHYKKLDAMINKYPVRLNHISGIKTGVLFKVFHKTSVDHHLDSLMDLDYIKQIPPHYFGSLLVLELENSLLEQLEIKKFLEILIP